MKKLAIVGMGLMGGSLGLAVKKAGIASRVVAYARREVTRRAALAMGAADEATDTPEAAVQGADMSVFCVPVLAIPDLVAACRNGFAPGSLVTDVGSTKDELVRAVCPLLAGTGAAFVGSHPMAGSEQAGIEASRPDLYEGAVVVVTPPEGADRRGSERVERFWAALGARVLEMAAAEHDEWVARTSHLPHLAAALLVSTAFRDGGDRVQPLVGTGFRDTTRVAAGSEDVWHDIVKSNRAAVGRELAAFGRAVEGLRAMVERGDFEGVRGLLAAARSRRQAIGGESVDRRVWRW